MPIDTDTPGSAGWWLSRLAKKLEDRQRRLVNLDDRFRGDPPLPEGAQNCRDSYLALQKKARTNFAELVVEAARQRMVPVGFRTAAAADENGDEQARRIWDANGLRVESADVHASMLAMGDAYVIVGGPDPETNVPVITGEDPRQVVTVHDPLQQRRVRAALKMFYDPEESVRYAYLYLPGVVLVASSPVGRGQSVAAVYPSPSSNSIIPATTSGLGTVPKWDARAWDWEPDMGGELPFPVIPVVRFRNRRGVGEFEPHTDLLDRINHQILQRMVIATMQAFRQRAIKNAPLEDESGNEINYDELFQADPGAVWALPGDVEMWESGQVDLTPILQAVKDDVQHLAAVTATPLHILSPATANQSAEGASLVREGLVFRVEDRRARAAEAWRDVMSLAFLFAGQKRRADRSKIEVLWDSPDRESLAERADAAVKAQASGVPWRAVMTDIWKFLPEQVARMEEERAAETAPEPAPVVPAQPSVDTSTQAPSALG